MSLLGSFGLTPDSHRRWIGRSITRMAEDLHAARASTEAGACKETLTHLTRAAFRIGEARANADSLEELGLLDDAVTIQMNEAVARFSEARRVLGAKCAR